MEQKKNQYIDEINLAEYVKVIFKRWKLIFLIFVLAILTGFIFSVISPKIYLVDTTLDLARIGEDLVENPSQLIEKIHNGVYNGKYAVRIIAENPKDTRLIKMKAETSDIESGKNALEEAGAVILAEHQSIINIQKESMQSDIEKLENKIKLLEQNISKTKNKIAPMKNDIERINNKIGYSKQEQKNLEDKIASLEKVLIYDQSPGTQFALFDTKEKLESKKQETEDLYLKINSLNSSLEDLNIAINNTETDKSNLELEMNNLNKSLQNIQSTKIIKPITISSAPIKPRPMLNTAIAGVLGLFIGVFLAFGREWWKTNMHLAGE